MANDISVSIEINGPFDQLVKLKDFVRSKNEEFSFEKIVPIPEPFKMAQKSKHQIEEYTTWLMQNWGCSPVLESTTCLYENPTSLRYSFNTRNSSPGPLIEKLSSLFPNMVIVMYAEDEFDGMRAMNEDHRGIYGISASIFCNGELIQTFQYPKLDFYELRKLAKELGIGR